MTFQPFGIFRRAFLFFLNYFSLKEGFWIKITYIIIYIQHIILNKGKAGDERTSAIFSKALMELFQDIYNLK